MLYKNGFVPIKVADSNINTMFHSAYQQFNQISKTINERDILANGPWVDVRHFGAMGLGIDYTTNIQNAINSLGGTGGVVFFPRGLYFTHKLLVPSNVILVGSGFQSILRLINGANEDLIYATGQYIGIKDLQLDGNKANQTTGAAVIKFNNVTDSFIKNCLIMNSKYSGITIVGGEQVLVGENIIKNAEKVGILFNGSTLCLANQNRIKLNTGGISGYHGILFYNATTQSMAIGNLVKVTGLFSGITAHTDCDYNTILGNRLLGCVNGVELASADHCKVLSNFATNDRAGTDYESGIEISNSDYAVVAENDSINNEWAGIFVGNSDYCTVTGNRTSLNKWSGIIFQASNYNTATGNISTKNNGNGILLSNGSKYNTVTANTCIDNAANDGDQDGIRVQDDGTGCTYNTITGNTCTDTRDAGSKQQVWGIREKNNSDYNQIHGNITSGNKTGEVSIVGANSNEWDNDGPTAGGGGADHNLLSATHLDTLTASVVRGDIIVGNSTPKWSRLAKGTSGYLVGYNANDVAIINPATLDVDKVDGSDAADFAPAAQGVTNGNAHDHNGGDGGQIDHENLANKGTNTHAQIDTHISATVSVHGFDASGNAPAQTHGTSRHTGTIGTWAQIDKTTSSIADITTKSHTALTDIGTNSHATIDTHLAATAPHSGHLKADGTVPLTADWDAGNTRLITAGYIALGASAAASGRIRLPNSSYIQARNAAGSGDIGLVVLNGSNVEQFYDGAASLFSDGEWRIANELSLGEMSAPSNVASYGKLYAKTDTHLYYKTSGGTEYALTPPGSGSVVGYAINVQALTSSPTDGQTVYFGMMPKAPVTTAAISKCHIRKAGTIKIVNIYCYSGTAGSNENWSLYIRINNTTDYLIATLGVSTNERIFYNASLSIAVSVGDYFEIKGVQPTWGTNPLTTIYGGYVYIE